MVTFAQYNINFNIAKTYQMFIRRKKRIKKINIITNLRVSILQNNVYYIKNDDVYNILNKKPQ
jgi:hypothetical protein